MTKLVNRAKMTTATTGTGTITLGSAVDGYQTFAAAGVTNADVVRYVIEDGDAWEIGLGTYTATGTTLTRGSIESSNADNLINLSGNAVVYITVTAADILKPEILAVASGTLSDGTKVIVNIDGTVSAIRPTEGPTVFGDKVVYLSSSLSGKSAAYDVASGKIVVTSGSQVFLGTVSGTSITFGSATVMPNVGGNSLIPEAAVYDVNAKKVLFICIASSPSYGYAVVGTVSGSSISFGTPSFYNFSSTMFASGAVYDPISQQTVFGYAASSSNKTFVRVATISGTSVSFGSATEVFNGNVETFFAYDLAQQKIVVCYSGTSSHGTARVCTVSGTSVSAGAATVFNAATTNSVCVVYDSTAQKTVFGFSNGANSNFASAKVGTISGTSITFGSTVVLNSASSFFSTTIYDEAANKFVLVLSSGVAFIGVVSGTLPVLQRTETYNPSSASEVRVAFDGAENKVVFAYADVGNSFFSTSRVLETVTLTPNLTATNFIGISSGSYADGQTATIQIVGAVDDAQSGLVAGSAYYVQTDGTLSQTPNTPSVFAGTAITSTKIIVKG